MERITGGPGKIYVDGEEIGEIIAFEARLDTDRAKAEMAIEQEEARREWIIMLRGLLQNAMEEKVQKLLQGTIDDAKITLAERFEKRKQTFRDFVRRR